MRGKSSEERAAYEKESGAVDTDYCTSLDLEDVVDCFIYNGSEVLNDKLLDDIWAGALVPSADSKND